MSLPCYLKIYAGCGRRPSLIDGPPRSALRQGLSLAAPPNGSQAAIRTGGRVMSGTPQ